MYFSLLAKYFLLTLQVVGWFNQFQQYQELLPNLLCYEIYPTPSVNIVMQNGQPTATL